MKEMRKAIEVRGIKYVFHFTRLANLPRIMAEGLIPRNELEKLANPPTFNDEYRYDLQKDAICCSLSFPNYKMFYLLRQQHVEEWVICVMNSSVLWKKECAFCVENAASNHVTCIPLEDRQGLDAFNAMFGEIDGKPLRSQLGVADSYPTNPQAEVLVLDSIEPSYIYGAACYSKETAARLVKEHTGHQFLHTPSLFYPRSDYRHWK